MSCVLFHSLCRCFPIGWPFYAGVIGPFVVIYTFNTIMFIIIMVSLFCGQGKHLLSTYKNRKKATAVFVLGVMFGLGWIFGILGTDLESKTVSLVFQFIFIFVVSFQGFLIFLVHPCRSKDVRNQWKKWFYYVTCRPQLIRYISSTSAVQRVHGQHSSSTPSVRNRPSQLTPLSAAGGSLIYRHQSSVDDISIVSSTRSSSHQAGRSVSAMHTDSFAAGLLTPTHLQAPTLDPVQEEPTAEEASPFHSLIPSSLSFGSGDSFHIFGNNHADVDSDDDYFLSQ